MNKKYQSLLEAKEVDQNTCDRLGIRGLTAKDLKELECGYVASKDVLQFPLRNAAGLIVGEKLYNLSNKTEETVQNQNASGLLIGGAVNKNRAILVTNLIDFLVLSMQKLDCKFAIKNEHLIINIYLILHRFHCLSALWVAAFASGMPTGIGKFQRAYILVSF